MRQNVKYDLISMGRACIDFYANEIGVPFPEVKSFAAYVGGCPANVAVGTRRLGLRVAMVSAVGDDAVGDFVLRFLGDEGIETRFVARKPGHRTGAAALAIMPPDTFPLIYYRENAADIQFDIDDALAAPVDQAKALLISGTGLSKEPSRSATMLAAEQARSIGTETLLDLDLRTDQWHDLRAYGVTMRAVLPNIDIVIGTEDEIKGVNLRDLAQMTVANSQVSSADVSGDLSAAIRLVQALGPRMVVVKRGKRGASIFCGDDPEIIAPGFPVEIVNTLGAGDAFAGGFIYGRIQGWDAYRSARLGNACGAIVVTRHACANSMPFLDEVLAFVEERGGL